MALFRVLRSLKSSDSINAVIAVLTFCLYPHAFHLHGSLLLSLLIIGAKDSLNKSLAIRINVAAEGEGEYEYSFSRREGHFTGAVLNRVPTTEK